MIKKTPDFEAKLSRINRKITENKTENVLVKNEWNTLKTFDSSYFFDKSHFEEHGTQNHLVFQPVNKCFKVITNTDYISSWKPKVLSSESIKPPTTSDISLTPALSYYGTKTSIKITGSCLKQPKILYTHGKVVNIYIVYELGASSSHNNDPTLKDCLFGALTLTKTQILITMGTLVMEFDLIEDHIFHFQVVGLVKIFEADMSFSAHIDSKKRNILVLGKGPIQGLE